MSCGCEPGGASGESRSSDVVGVWRIAVAIALAGQSMLISLTVNVSAMRSNERHFFHALLIALLVATHELVGGPLWNGLRQGLAERRLRFELLFASAIAGALGLSLVSVWRGHGDVYFDVAAVLLTLHAVGHRVNGIERQKSFAAVQALRLPRQKCTVRTCCGSTKVVAAEDVTTGQVILVHPGERVALDGTVEQTEAFVREAPITGEPHEVVKCPGDSVRAGSVVVDATLRVRVTATVGRRVVDQVASEVEAAWSRASHAQRLADRLTRRLLPAVLLVATATLIGWSLVRDLDVGMLHAMAVLVVACPCAMGFAIPLTVAGSLGALGSRGVELRGGDALERLAEIDVVVLDKTGTLTRADSRLVDAVFTDDAPYDRVTLREIFSSVERASHHPIAHAFRDMAATDERFTVDRVRVVPAKGIEAEVLDRSNGARIQVALGTAGLVPPGGMARFNQLQHRVAGPPGTHRIVAVLNGELVALTTVREQPREGASLVVAALERLGLRVFVLTGDRSAARSSGFGTAAVEHGLEPMDKAKRVQELSMMGHRVLFVGDGINDSAAMAASHAALAPEDGTELARDAAQGVFRGGAMLDLAWAIAAARRSIASLRGNLRYAVMYNAVGVTVAALGFVDPVFAALLMVCSSLFVTFRASAFISQLAAPGPDESATQAETVPAPSFSFELTPASEAAQTRDHEPL